jgi:hypothetical protein
MIIVLFILALLYESEIKSHLQSRSQGTRKTQEYPSKKKITQET